MKNRILVVFFLVAFAGVAGATRYRPGFNPGFKKFDMNFSIKETNDDGSLRTEEEIKQDFNKTFDESFKNVFGWLPKEDEMANFDPSTSPFEFVPVKPTNAAPKFSLEQLLFFYKAAKALEKKNQK